MRRLTNKKAGSIVVFSLMILSIMIALTQQLLKSVYVSSSFIRAMVDRERAEMIALGGVNVALELLKLQLKDKEEKKTGAEQSPPSNEQSGQEKDKKEDSGTKKFLRRVLPYMNRWMTFSLDEAIDGVAGEVKICISCEHGKININEIYDFKKEEFRKEYENLLKTLEIKGQLPAGELFNRLLEFFKKKKRRIEDISELYEIKGIDTLNIFYQPPNISSNEKEKSQPNKHLALQDLFTIWTDDYLLEPLMFSDALCALFALRRPMANDAQIMKDRFKQVIDTFQPTWGLNWQDHWRFLQPMYDEKRKLVNGIEAIFSKQFGPTVYSVLSSGKVGDVEQQLLAIVKKVETQDPLVTKNKKDGQQKKDEFKVVRAYWI